MQTHNDANVVSFQAKPKKPSLRFEGEKPIASANSEIADAHVTPIHALIEFVADQIHISEALVHVIVTTAFHIEHIDQLPVQDYGRTIHFLMELRRKVVTQAHHQSFQKKH